MALLIAVRPLSQTSNADGCPAGGETYIGGHDCVFVLRNRTLGVDEDKCADRRQHE